MSIIAILTDGNTGGTFLNWSIHYLAGHNKYFNSIINEWSALPMSPLTTINSHNFKPNQPSTYTEFNHCLIKLISCNTPDFHTVYFHQFREASSNIFSETQQAMNDITSIAEKLVVLTNQPKNSLYHKSSKSRILTSKLGDTTVKNLSDEEQLNDFVMHFFKESFNQWQELQLTNIWDQREFIALNFRKDATSIAPYVNRSVNHFSLDCLEFFNTADAMISDLFNYLEIDIDATRIDSWNQIYQSWRKMHYNRLNFLWQFDKIIEYILNDYYMDLTRFNLDIVQEAFIQHELFYKHNLNLKTWQLEKFTNTKQLHNLLESNNHLLNTTI
jgi:hypothetical protein